MNKRHPVKTIHVFLLLVMTASPIAVLAEDSQETMANFAQELPNLTKNQLKDKLRQVQMLGNGVVYDAASALILRQMDAHDAMTLRLRGLIYDGRLEGTVSPDGVVFIKGENITYSDGTVINEGSLATDDIPTVTLERIWELNRQMPPRQKNREANTNPKTFGEKVGETMKLWTGNN